MIFYICGAIFTGAVMDCIEEIKTFKSYFALFLVSLFWPVTLGLLVGEILKRKEDKSQ